MILESRSLEGRRGHEAGRALLSELYTRETGDSLPEIRITEWGKPYFADSPWHFSISHTRRRVFVALSRHNIGIDAEELAAFESTLNKVLQNLAPDTDPNSVTPDDIAALIGEIRKNNELLKKQIQN
jgi:phosphopantetheinyl transferase